MQHDRLTRIGWIVLFSVMVFSGCLDAGVVRCADGRICPARTACTESFDLCVSPEQIDACKGRADRDECTFAGKEGVCNRGVCFEVGCGDGFLEPQSEECDYLEDRNHDCTEAGYYDPGEIGCTRTCQLDTSTCGRICGDGVLDPEEHCEEEAPAGFTCLDFGFHTGQLGCSSVCLPDTGGCRTFGWTRMPVASPQRLQAVSVYEGGALAVGGGAILRLPGLNSEQWEVELETSETLNDVWAASATRAVAVGKDGAILLYEGAAWTQAELPPAAADIDFRAVHGTGPDNVFAAGEDGVIVRFDGDAWAMSRDGDSGFDLLALWAVSPSEIYAGGKGPDYNLVTFNGETWTPAQVAGDIAIYGIYVAGEVGWIATGGSGLYQRKGNFWLQAPLPGYGSNDALRAVWGTDRDDVFAAGAGGVWHYDGVSWSELERPVAHKLYDVDGLGADVFAVGEFGTVLRNDGTLLVNDVVEGGDAIAVIDVAGPEDRYAAAAHPSKAIFHYESDLAGVAGWYLVHAPGESITALAVVTPGQVYAFGAAGAVYVGNENGFTEQAESLGVTIKDAWAGGEDEIYAVTFSGGGFHYNGAEWETLAFVEPGGGTLHAVFGTSSWIYAVGRVPASGAAIYRRAREGDASWEPMQLPDEVMEDDTFFDVWGSADDDVYAVGSSGEVVHYNGTTWSLVAMPLEVDFHSVWGTSATDVFVGGAGGIVFHYDGAAWSQVDVGMTANVVDGAASADRVFWAGNNQPPRIIRREPW